MFCIKIERNSSTACFEGMNSTCPGAGSMFGGRSELQGPGEAAAAAKWNTSSTEAASEWTWGKKQHHTEGESAQQQEQVWTEQQMKPEENKQLKNRANYSSTAETTQQQRSGTETSAGSHSFTPPFTYWSSTVHFTFDSSMIIVVIGLQPIFLNVLHVHPPLPGDSAASLLLSPFPAYKDFLCAIATQHPDS